MSVKELKERRISCRLCKCITSKYGGKIKKIRGEQMWDMGNINDNETFLLQRGTLIYNDGRYTGVMAHLKTCEHGKQINNALGKKKETEISTSESDKPYNFPTLEDKEAFDLIESPDMGAPDLLELLGSII